jgi:hypothetical protein
MRHVTWRSTSVWPNLEQRPEQLTWGVLVLVAAFRLLLLAGGSL